MGYLAGATAAIYRYTNDGRRLYAFGRLRGRYYLVADAAGPVLERRLRQYNVLCLALIAVLGFLSGRLEFPWIIALAGVCPLVAGPWLTRGLPRVHVSPRELQDVDASARVLAVARAFGGRTLWLILLGAVAMGSLGIMVGITENYWVGWLLFAMMAGVTWHMARLVRSLRHAADPEVSLRHD